MLSVADHPDVLAILTRERVATLLADASPRPLLPGISRRLRKPLARLLRWTADRLDTPTLRRRYA
jgi:hypothetical protein